MWYAQCMLPYQVIYLTKKEAHMVIGYVQYFVNIKDFLSIYLLWILPGETTLHCKFTIETLAQHCPNYTKKKKPRPYADFNFETALPSSKETKRSKLLFTKSIWINMLFFSTFWSSEMDGL